MTDPDYVFVDKKPYILSDIDGTVANCDHRRHLVEGEKKDFSAFYDEMQNDTPRFEIQLLLFALRSLGYPIIFVTGRPENYRAITEKWLNEYGFPSPLLFMRPENNTEADIKIKKEIYDEHLKDKKILLALDDRPVVIRLWEGLDIPVIDCGDGVEF